MTTTEEDLTTRLWQAAGENWRNTGQITVNAHLLLQALSAIRDLTTRLEASERSRQKAENDRHAAQAGFGGCQVERSHLRYRLAAALEIAEDRGVQITDEEVAAHIAATHQVTDDDVEEFALFGAADNSRPHARKAHK